jgi:hypothetical protein
MCALIPRDSAEAREVIDNLAEQARGWTVEDIKTGLAGMAMSWVESVRALEAEGDRGGLYVVPAESFQASDDAFRECAWILAAELLRREDSDDRAG